MRKIFWIIIVIAIIAVLAWLWRLGTYRSSTQGLPQLPRVSETDTSTQIQQDLDQIDVSDIDQQFKSIDADLNGL